MAAAFLKPLKRRNYTDAEVVEGIASRDHAIEEWFYKESQSYFNKHFNAVFFDKDLRQEIFQRTFLKLWVEMANGKICVRGGELHRQQTTGNYRRMTCSLSTFMMAIAKNENREIMRNYKEDNYADLFSEDLADCTGEQDEEEELKAQQIRMVDECIHDLSPHCVEILTLFYYQGKSLDEIMEIRKEKTTSKASLKSAKSKCMATLKEKVKAQFRSLGTDFS